MEWTYALIFALLVIDCLLPVVPAETSLIAGGALAADGRLELPIVLAAAMTAVAVGDVLTHEAARRGGHRLLDRWVRREHRGRITRLLDRRGGALVAAGRFVPLGRTTVALATGYARFPRQRFVPALLVGAALWTCYMVGLGYLGGHFFTHPVVAALLGVALSFAVTGVTTLVHRARLHRRRGGQGYV
ncbi:DedA family protein [Dactylosporangium sp. AC04546]|uniref:DedA family protein n=1 Tax=Dactylosporangium sp. AC04546 TaxID=2862460 RepID=UPI001EE02DEB|nr:DedA family protein [Dactylosporangium sp. AC04546]WVK83298.1 DedA family protein [Dactylosporangium sp. AC04546]